MTEYSASKICAGNYAVLPKNKYGKRRRSETWSSAVFVREIWFKGRPRDFADSI
jgi:hypothetical protein